jgi:hypothetical protein
MLHGPDPKALYPMKDYRKLIFLKNIITRKTLKLVIILIMMTMMIHCNLKTTFCTILICWAISLLSVNFAL